MTSPAPDRAEDDTLVDRLVAERLAHRADATGAEESKLTEAENDDLLRRLNALDFVDSLVGGVVMPDRIGDYRITGLLGRGGMGTVYGAFQESLEREVALKVLSPAFSADPTMRRRFRVEARATASLHHQHIVPIYDFGEAQGLLYFAMEKINGVSLDQHIARARRARQPLYAPLQAAHRFAGVAEALAHAHRRRILHRDIKPGNLLVHADGTLALADFGLSRMLGEASVRSTGRGGFLGTLQYASPEQARSAQLTPASDLYSLGVTAFEAITGQLPFRAETPEAVLDALLNHEPRKVRALRPDVPADLAAIIEKLLHKEPTDRYHDAEALARDLRRFADGEPVFVRRQLLVVRLWRRVRRRPGLSAAIAAASILGLTSIYAVAARVAEQRLARQARYASLLVDGSSTIADDPGPLGGPGDLLAVLTGVPHGAETSNAVDAALERARQFAPELQSAADLRQAYDASGDIAAEAHLRAGQGLSARRLLDARIKQSVREMSTFRPVDPIRLYRLFVARAVACLTAAVGDPTQARADLEVASLFRPGAFTPRVLRTIAELAFARDVTSVVDELDDRVRLGPKGGAAIAYELLLAATADTRAAGAHLMRFALSPGQRDDLSRAAQERLGAAAVPADGVRWSGLEGEFATLARAAASPDSPRREEQLRTGRRRLTEEVDPSAPLQLWALVFEMLQNPDRPDTSVVRVDLRPRACLELLALEPPVAMLGRLADSLTDAAYGAELRGELAIAAELRARLQLRLDPSRARPMVEVWVAQARDDAEAYMARFLCLVTADEVDLALDAATVAVQRASRPLAQRQRVIQYLRAAAATPSPRANAWTEAIAQFEPPM